MDKTGMGYIKKDDLKELIVTKVNETLLVREETGALKDECDFLVGAMTVMAVVNQAVYDSTEDNSMDWISPLWALFPMSGRSVVKELKLEASRPKTIIITDKRPTLEKLQKMVGGYIQVVKAANSDDQIIMDEEGKIKGKKINPKATELYVGEEYDDTCASWDYDTINGDAVVLKGDARLD